jgi:deoxycytidine triphosphate deaminase
MVIGTQKLLQLVKSHKLIENLDRRELKNPEGAGFDLRLEKLFVPTSPSFLGITQRQTGDLKAVASFKAGAKKQHLHTIKPGEFCLAKTIEKVNMPNNLLAIIKPRTTLFRFGVFLRTGFTPPGYSGDLYFGLFNAGLQEYRIEMGARFCHIIFLQISGNLVRTYQGQWQGGRATTKDTNRGLEKQI